MRVFTALSLFVLSAGYAVAAAINLGTADSFAVLAGQSITNSGSTTVLGSIGVSPGTAVSGFAPGTQVGSGVAMQAQNDLAVAYNAAAGAACSSVLTGQDLGGQTLTPGVYCFDSSAQLTGTLTLDGKGDPNAIFIFQIGSTLTTASGSVVAFLNAGEARGVFWQVGRSATLGTTTTFAGNILASTSITLNTGAIIECGRVLAIDGSVTLDSNVVSNSGCEASTESSATPEPSMFLLVGLVLAGGVVWTRQLTACTLREA